MYLSITTIIARARIKQTIGSPTPSARIRGHTLPSGPHGCAAGIARHAPDELTSLSEKPEPPPADVDHSSKGLIGSGGWTRALSANGLAMRMKETAPVPACKASTVSQCHPLLVGFPQSPCFLCAPKLFASPEV
jgi:hypothetical protein